MADRHESVNNSLFVNKTRIKENHLPAGANKVVLASSFFLRSSLEVNATFATTLRSA